MQLNIPWRIGVNIRELVYYGEPNATFAGVGRDVRRTQLEALHDIGVQVVRFYAPHNQISTERSIQLIGEALDLLREFDMQAVVCLQDAISDSGYFFDGDRGSYRDESNGHLHRDYWINKGYETHYLPFVKALVTKFKDHPGVLIWELGNEQAVRPQDNGPDVKKGSDSYLEYAEAVAKTIRFIDRNALIGTGLVNSRHVFHTDHDPELRAFSKKLHTIVDAVSLHVYEQDTGEIGRLNLDADVAGDLRKPMYVGELGSNFHQHVLARKDYYRQQIDLWRGRGAFMVMPWAFNVTQHHIADDFGISKVFGDFDDLIQVLRETAGSTTAFIPAALREVLTPADGIGEIGSEQPLRGEASAATELVEVQPKRFHVTTKLSIRFTPTLQSPRVKKNGQTLWLFAGDIIEVDPDSRTEADEHIWWKHSLGWSAERPLDNSEIYLKEIIEEPTNGEIGLRLGSEIGSEQPLRGERSGIAEITEVTPKRVRVNTKLSIRFAPSQDSARVTKNGETLWLFPGDIIELDPTSRVQGEEFIWWRHSAGWSAERPLDNSEIYFEELSEAESENITSVRLDDRDVLLQLLFQKTPVNPSDIAWLQYFGSTTFAHRLASGEFGEGAASGYAYAQGFHAGIDFGNKRDVDVSIHAGVKGKISRVMRDSRFFKPNFVEVKSGDYLIIYGHLTSIVDGLEPDQVVTADTKIGDITHGENQHLHLEVRKSTHIINPLILMPEDVQSAVMALDNPSFFVSPTDPNLWQDPLDQPVIERGGSWAAPWTPPRA